MVLGASWRPPASVKAVSVAARDIVGCTLGAGARSSGRLCAVRASLVAGRPVGSCGAGGRFSMSCAGLVGGHTPLQVPLPGEPGDTMCRRSDLGGLPPTGCAKRNLQRCIPSHRYHPRPRQPDGKRRTTKRGGPGRTSRDPPTGLPARGCARAGHDGNTTPKGDRASNPLRTGARFGPLSRGDRVSCSRSSAASCSWI